MLSQSDRDKILELLPMAESLARWLCPGDADALGEAALELCLRVPTYEPGPASLRTYCWKRVYWRLLTHRRDRRREERTGLPLEEMPDRWSAPVDISPHLRPAVELHYVRGVPLKVCAKMLGLSQVALDRKLRAARAELLESSR